MKRIIAFIIASALLMAMGGCTSPVETVSAEKTDLMDGITAKPVSSDESLISDNALLADFGIRMLQSCFNETQNVLVSPLSVLYALAMTANGADGETLAQMEEVFGADVDSLNPYLQAFMKQQSEHLVLANSIWLKDDPELTVQESFLQTNADYYGADVFQAVFDRSTLEDINRWVEENTDGIIREILDHIPEDAVMYLVNALTFDAEWQEIYEEHRISEAIFTTESGEKRNIELMYSTEQQYLQDDLATGFIKYYEEEKYAFVAMLPNEGVSVEEYAASLTGEHFYDLISNSQDITTYVCLPKFEVGYDLEMREVLEGMGMTDAFDWTVADFSQMGSYMEGNLCINRVLHKTFLTVDERGTKAGAATMAEAAAEGCEIEPQETKTVKLDRPFVYFLVECESNQPSFIGTMMDSDQTQVSADPVGVADHIHSLASEPQLTDDPVSGYCGNTVTTVYHDGQEYSFMGSDSVALTDLLINLEYDPLKVCKCLPEYTVDTEFGGGYGISLSGGYARCENGQTDLTREQVELAREIMGRLY